jgi:cell division protein FtsB
MDLRIKRPEIRVLSRAAHGGLSAPVERAPQAEAFGPRVAHRIGHRLGHRIGPPINQKVRPALAWLYGARRRLATSAVAVVTVWLFLHVMFGANGMVVYRQKRAEYQSLSGEIDQLQKENDHYTAQIKALQTDPETIEKEAREQLHYARPGEVVYVSPAPPPAPTPATNAAQK